MKFWVHFALPSRRLARTPPEYKPDVYKRQDYAFDTPKEPVVLNQQGCMYDPHIIALMTGQTFEVKNDDQTTHNIHPMPKDNREWNKSQPPGATPIDLSLIHI